MGARKLLVVVAAIFFSILDGKARPVQGQPPEVLENMAPVVCNGRVLSVHAGIRIDSHYADVSPPVDKERWMEARIQMLHLFKGSVPAEFIFRYRVGLPDATEVDGPMHIGLQPGQRYRFFLRPDAARNGYVDVLDGVIDDYEAVEGLGSSERDDADYLRRDRAIAIALEYLRSAYPKRAGTKVSACFYSPQQNGEARWLVLVLPQNRDVPSAGVYVRNDGSVDVATTGSQM